MSEKKSSAKIADFQQDRKNANRGTQRGLAALDNSLRKYGAGRSVLVDRNNRVIAGNKTIERAADIGLDDVIVVDSDGTKLVAVRRTDLDLETDSAARELAYADNRVAELDLDFDPLTIAADLEAGLDLSGLWDDTELAAILEAAGSALAGENEKRQITRTGRLYNAGDGHNVEPFKLAYRIEAIWRASGNLALDLFSGEGQLAAWYKRRFKRVVTVDKSYQVGDVDYSMPAGEFIDKHIQEFIDFDFIDFDDEGTPAREIQRLFKAIEGCKAAPFVLALTDGNGMNLKFRGKLDFLEVYQTGESGIRHATRADYDNFEDTVTGFIERCATGAKFTPTMLSSYRGREGNVLFQTWLIEPVSIASR